MSRLRTVGVSVAVVAAAAVVLALAWVVGGNAVAERREREAAREWEKNFGSYQALVRKYTVAESNASAVRVEEVAKEMGFDLAIGHARSDRGPLPDSVRDALRSYVDGELTQTTGIPSPPPPGLVAWLDINRGSLFAFEEVLSSAPAPRWACDPSGDPDDWPRSPLGTYLQLGRVLVADALSFSSKGKEAEAARALDAAWALSGSVSARPAFTSQMIATAASKLLAGALRRTGGSARVWVSRLDEMGSRQRLLDALVLEHGDVGESRARLRRLMAREETTWYAATRPIQQVRERLWSADFTRHWSREIAGLRDAKAFAEPAAERTPRTSEEIILAIAIPSIRNAFARADRLALDAELTEKILQLRDARKTRRAWPEPSGEITSSRFAGLSWSYDVRGDAASLALKGRTPPPDPYSKGSLVLPLSFSSGPPQP